MLIPAQTSPTGKSTAEWLNDYWCGGCWKCAAFKSKLMVECRVHYVMNCSNTCRNCVERLSCFSKIFLLPPNIVFYSITASSLQVYPNLSRAINRYADFRSVSELFRMWSKPFALRHRNSRLNTVQHRSASVPYTTSEGENRTSAKQGVEREGRCACKGERERAREGDRERFENDFRALTRESSGCNKSPGRSGR